MNKNIFNLTLSNTMWLIWFACQQLSTDCSPPNTLSSISLPPNLNWLRILPDATPHIHTAHYTPLLPLSRLDPILKLTALWISLFSPRFASAPTLPPALASALALSLHRFDVFLLPPCGFTCNTMDNCSFPFRTQLWPHEIFFVVVGRRDTSFAFQCFLLQLHQHATTQAIFSWTRANQAADILLFS